MASSLYTCRACTRALLTPSSRPASQCLAAASQAQHQHRSYATKKNVKTAPAPTSKPASAPKPASAKPSATPTKPATSTTTKPATPTAPAKPPVGHAKPFPSTLSGQIASKLRQKAPLFTETYVAYGACASIIKECVRAGDYKIPQALEKKGEIPVDENGTHIGVGEGWWYDKTSGLGLTPTFLNWTQITFIHMWLMQVRFRMLPATHAPLWIEHMTNHAFYAAEDRLAVWHKYTAASLRQKAMKDMFSQWRAVLLSYDEGLVKGDAVLAAAVWRNLMGAREDVDFEKLGCVVGYMRRELQRLERASDDEVVDGGWKFGADPGAEKELVGRQSGLAARQVARQ